MTAIGGGYRFLKLCWFKKTSQSFTQTSLNALITRINEHKFDQRSEVCKHLLANPTHRFNFKQPEILGSIVGQKELLLESLLIEQYQPDLNVDGSSIPLLFLTHNGLYDATQYECPKLHPYFSFNCRMSFIPDDGLRISRNVE